MSLNARMSLFFLITLAVVLAGFSLGLYLLAGAYLNNALDGRLTAALAVLTTVVETKSDGFVFDAEDPERRIPVGLEGGGDQVCWVVLGPDEHVVARSPNWPKRNAPLMDPVAAHAGVFGFTAADGNRWRVAQRLLEAYSLLAPEDHDPADAMDPEDANDMRYPVLVLRACIPVGTVNSTLRSLAVTLLGISLALWLAAGSFGTVLGRRALLPLANLGRAARELKASDAEQRLPIPGTGDELDEVALGFNDLLARLQEAHARHARFAGDASHQLRTPLTALLGQVEVALRQERQPEEYRHILGKVQAQGKQLVRIVEMLLFLARTDPETPLPEREEVELTIWILEQRERWASHPRNADIGIERPAQPVTALVHPGLLGQLLDNLIDNACKYSSPGSPITIRLAEPEGNVTLQVQDRGMGIAPTDLEHVFEPLFRSTGARRLGVPGAGLGLAIVKRVAEGLGGTVAVESESGGGSVFTVTLPG